MTLVDSNVVLDVVTNDDRWADWSQAHLEQAAAAGSLIVNDVIYAEISTRYRTIEAVDAMLEELDIDVVKIPRAALFLAGKAYLRYRAIGGVRTGVLSDFFYRRSRRSRAAAAPDAGCAALPHLFPDS